MTTQAVATKAITAAQWLWNAAMTANPIGLIIVGIAAMIALLVVAVKNWNEWGAALAIFLGPLGLTISLIQAFRRNWELISEAFKTDGMVAGIKMIGITLLDVVLMPLQQILEIISKVTGADWAKTAADNVNKFRSSIGTNLGNESQGPTLETGNPAQNRAEMISKNIEEKRSQAFLSITTPPGFGSDLSAPPDFPIQLSSTR
jgi:hypothetical protein